MKRTIKYILGFALLLGVFTQCDKIEEPYLKNPPEELKKSAILEVFTGHKDAASPEVMTAVKDLSTKYGNDLSVIVYHAGDLAQSDDGDYPVDYTTAIGTEIFTEFAGESAKGMLMRGAVAASDNWDADIQATLEELAKVELSLDESYDVEAKTLSVSVECEVLEMVDAEIKIATYLVEDSLVSAQNLGESVDAEYIHMNVFRASLDNEAFGAFAIESPAKESYNHTYDALTINNNWAPNHLRVIAIAYTGDVTNPEVLNVKSIAVDAEPSDGPEKKRKVLIEEFTGHRCVNCPTATLEMKNLIEKYEDQVIGIAYHFGYYAEPVEQLGFPVDYQTAEGDELGEFYNIAATPYGMVNRTGALLYADWEAELVTLLEKEAEAGMLIEQSYNEENSKLDVTVNTTFFSDEIEGNVRVAVYLVEDDVVSPQLNGNPAIGEAQIDDYHHMEMFRTSMNESIWGEVLTESIDLSQTYTTTQSFTLEEGWVADNMKIIAVLMNTTNNTVIQAEEVHLGVH
jgi:hypothetical protein